MFKHYLTYNLALSFHRSCMTLNMDHTGSDQKVKDRLMRSADLMSHHFAKSIHTQDKKEEAKNLFVTLICLRDCREILEDAEIRNPDLTSQYEVLHSRLEQLCLDTSEIELGQLRMLG